MNLLTRFASALIVLGTLFQAHASELKQSGDYEIASTFTLSYKVLNEERDILISLPRSYSESEDTYPVLVLLDGNQNIEHAVASARN